MRSAETIAPVEDTPQLPVVITTKSTALFADEDDDDDSISSVSGILQEFTAGFCLQGLCGSDDNCGKPCWAIAAPAGGQ